MQAIDQSGSVAESAFRLFRFFLEALIFLVAVAAARWGIRTFLLGHGGRSSRWRNSFSAINLAALVLLLLLRSPADMLLTSTGDAIARLRPKSEPGWLACWGSLLCSGRHRDFVSRDLHRGSGVLV